MWIGMACVLWAVTGTGGASGERNGSRGAAAEGRCQDGLVIPVWEPTDDLGPLDRLLRGAVYFFALLYLFLGVSIISDRFMSAIEVITSQEREVVVTSKGERKTIFVRVWNETVANLTLMALGSSAPEIMLSVIEIWAKNFNAGDLGPGTIVGSAAYNLFVIIAICVSVIPNGETRKIQQLAVFFVTATWSVFAYIWLYLILAVISEGVVEVWEGIVTFLFFPLTVCTAYLADKKIPIYKIPLKLFKYKSHRAVGAAENVDLELSRSDGGGEDLLEDARQKSANVLKELQREFPDKSLAELKKLARERLEQCGPKSRAFYRIQATRTMTGGSFTVRGKEVSPSPEEPLPRPLDETTYIEFGQPEYTVLENIGSFAVKVLLRGPRLNFPLLVDYQSEDGTATAGSDYMAVSGTLVFKPGQLEQYFKVKIIDDDVFEEDEFFYIHLSNPRLQGSKGTGLDKFKLGELSTCKVFVLDDDHSGVFGFPESSVQVPESVGVYQIVIERRTGARGRVRVPYHTQDGTARAGKDYIDMRGTLLFENNEPRKTLPLRIISENSYERNVSLSVVLGEPMIEISTNHLRGSQKNITGREMTAAEKIAMEGYPALGEISTLTINIRESLEFKDTVDMLVETRGNSSIVVGTSSWREQFADAIRVKPDADDEEEVTCCDYVMHFISLFWKILFAFVPPTDLYCGYLCFALSIVCIGVLTALIGDLASHFGCTAGIEDAVTAVTFVALGTSVPEILHGWICFWVSILWIGMLTAIIGDLASAFGCTVGIADAVTAISIVALGTSLPDTFASKVSAIQDSTADNSVGNVTGSNAVNVFLGIGIAWSIAALYHASKGNEFRVPPGNLAFSVTLFCTEAVIAIVIIVARRCKPVGGELGGPTLIKYVTSLVFVSLWLFYVTMSTLEVYHVIEGF